MTEPARPGDLVYLTSTVLNVHWYGLVSDIDSPTNMVASLEAVGQTGSGVVGALVGPPGPPGEASILLRLQASTIDDPNDLPDDLLDIPEDYGKTWIIGPTAYIWVGDRWLPKNIGVVGPPGPVPRIRPSVQLIDPLSNEQSSIAVTGSDLEPGWLLRLKCPQGPKGDNSRVSDSEDVNQEIVPTEGQVLAWNTVLKKWEPRDPNPVGTLPYTIPQSAFTTSLISFGTNIPIGSFQIPSQDRPVKIILGGTLGVNGGEIDLDPFTMVVEARLGGPNGKLIAIGRGGNTVPITLVPWFGTEQMTPYNNVGLLPANTTGTAATIYFALRNSGVAGVYNFQKEEAYVSIQLLPC